MSIKLYVDNRERTGDPLASFKEMDDIILKNLKAGDFCFSKNEESALAPDNTEETSDLNSTQETHILVIERKKWSDLAQSIKD